MAPRKPALRTYGRPNKSINSVDAFNKLFVKNLTKRKLNKFEIKKLPDIKTVLSNDSIDVTTNNTFDRLFKGLNQVHIKKSTKKVSTRVTVHSPILTRSKKLHGVDDTSLFSKELTKSSTNSLSISRFKQQTRSNERIDESLLIEKETNLRNLRSNSKTYLKIPQSTVECTTKKVEENTIPDKFFTNSLREAITVHSSTPVACLKTKKHIIKHPISPIRNELEKVIENSFEEVKQWDTKLPFKNTSTIRSNDSVTKLEDFLGFTKTEQTSNYSSSRTKRDSFINLRSRKVNKSSSKKNFSSDLFSVKENTSKSKSFSLEDFENFELRQSTIDNSSMGKNHKTTELQNKELSYSLDNFEKFVAKYTSSLEHSSVNRGNVSHSNDFDLSSSSYLPRAAKKFPDNYFVTQRRPRLSFSERRLFNQFKCKELAIESPKLPMHIVDNGSVNLPQLFTKKLVVNLERPLVLPKMYSAISCRDLVVKVTNIDFKFNDINFNNDLHKELVVKVTPLCDKILPTRMSERNVSSEALLKNVTSISTHIDDIKSFEPDSPSERSISTYTISDESSINSSRNSETKHHHSPMLSYKELSENLENVNFEKELIVKIQNYSILTVTSPQAVSGERNKRLTRRLTGNSEVSRTKSLDTENRAENKSLEEDQFSFKAPLPVAKTPLHLKSGKLWRRSLLNHKRESALQNSFVSTPGDDSTVCKSVRRESIRIIPLLEDKRKKTSLLETYAKFSLSNLIKEEENISLQTYTERKSKSIGLWSGIVKNTATISAQDIVLSRCDQTKILPFETCYPDRLLDGCRKIGEGVYGEVFLYNRQDGGTTVMKVIPVEGDHMVNGDRQKKFQEILSEIVITKELSNLRNKKVNYTSSFTEVQRVCCVFGEYPQRLIHLWNTYNQEKGSENDSPEIFEGDQQYIVLDLGNGGQDLEAFVFNNAMQAFAVFQQVTCALAVAEEELKFEHRDLHWGNVLVTQVDKNNEAIFRLNGKEYKIQTKGVRSTIIDFTLSRVECDGVILFNDLSQDLELFTSEGDYQFDIYRLMQKRNGNDWQKFEPYSNVLWLHYILEKAVEANGLRYKNPKTKIHKDYLSKLRHFKNNILNYCSVKEFVTSQF